MGESQESYRNHMQQYHCAMTLGTSVTLQHVQYFTYTQSPVLVQSSDFSVFYSMKINPDKPFSRRFVLIIN